MGKRIIIFLLLFLFCLTGTSVSGSLEVKSHTLALVVSLKIRPYLEVVEGVKEGLSSRGDTEAEIFFLEDFKGKSRAALSEKLLKGNFACFVAIGPEAFRFISTDLDGSHRPKLYSMILNPESVTPEGEYCGVPLNIPVEKQIRVVKSTFPDLNSMGLLFDPKNNADFAREAGEAGKTEGLKIVPLAIETRSSIPAVLEKNWNNTDALWLIPDRTVITESLVRHIIKEAILNRKAVIGYNRFFHKSGAALSFVFDYREIGKMTAGIAHERISGEPCKKESPPFEAWLNMGVLKTLGIRYMADEKKGVKARQ